MLGDHGCLLDAVVAACDLGPVLLEHSMALPQLLVLRVRLRQPLALGGSMGSAAACLLSDHRLLLLLEKQRILQLEGLFLLF